MIRGLAPRRVFATLPTTLPLLGWRHFALPGVQGLVALRPVAFVPSRENSSVPVSWKSSNRTDSELGGGLPFVSSWVLNSSRMHPRPPQLHVVSSCWRRWLSSSKKKKKAGGPQQPKAARPPRDVAEQHEEWVAFQRKIAVPGFETGQQTEVSTKSRRGGRRKKHRLHDDEEDDSKRFTDLKGGEFPPRRYGDEETARLLAQAYANLPPRAGKRGTRNLKRQGRRWFLVRKVRKLYKHHMAHHQERKMAKRSEKIRQVKQVLHEAPRQQAADRLYQAQVYASWATRVLKQIP